MLVPTPVTRPAEVDAAPVVRPDLLAPSACWRQHVSARVVRNARVDAGARAVGVAAVAVPRRPGDAARDHRVLVTRLDGAGDVLLAGPAVRAVAAPRAEVTLLCGPAGAAAGRLLPGVADVLVWASPWVVNPAPPIDRAALDRFVDDLAARGVRRGRDPHVVPPVAAADGAAPAAGRRRRITGASIDYPGTLLDVRLRPGDGPGDDLPEDLPEPERALAIAAAAGLPAAGGRSRRARGAPPAPARRPARARCRPALRRAAPRRRRRRAALARRAPPAGRGAARGRRPRGRRHRRPRRARPHRARSRPAPPARVDLGGRTGLAELSAVLAGAAAVVVGNTGAAHLAAAVGTPVVSLFAPVVPAVRWRPYRVRQVLLGDQDAPCRDTRARDCPVPGHPVPRRASRPRTCATPCGGCVGPRRGPTPRGAPPVALSPTEGTP